MEITIGVILGGLACFAGGVVFSKTALSDLSAMKLHVTSEVAALRGDLSALLSGAAKKL